MGSLSLTLAWRYFRARREGGLVSLVTTFSIAGLAVGVATLIVAMAVFTGFRLELRSRLFQLEGALKVLPQGGAYVQIDSDMERAMANSPLVDTYQPFLSAATLIFAGETGRGALLRGLRRDDTQAAPLAGFLTAGTLDFAAIDGAPGAVIGTALADDLSLGLGDGFRAYETAGLEGQAGTLPKTQRFVVTGLIDTGIEVMNEGLVLTDAAAVRTLIGLPEAEIFSGAYVHVHDALDQGAAFTQLSQALVGHPLIVQSSLNFDPARDGRLGSIGAHLQLAEDQEAMMIIVLALIVAVAALGVIAGQMMKVEEKSREIAVLRSIGASRGLVLRVFLALGLLIGLVGAGLGIALGLLIALNLDDIRLVLEGWTGRELFPADQFRLAFLPSRPTARVVLTAGGVALVLTLLAMAAPAIRAARLSPAEALRYE